MDKGFPKAQGEKQNMIEKGEEYIQSDVENFM